MPARARVLGGTRGHSRRTSEALVVDENLEPSELSRYATVSFFIRCFSCSLRENILSRSFDSMKARPASALVPT
eukprot:3910989-Prymnesium_polylepis.1